MGSHDTPANNIDAAVNDAICGGRSTIYRNDDPVAVLISADEFKSLVRTVNDLWAANHDH